MEYHPHETLGMAIRIMVLSEDEAFCTHLAACFDEPGAVSRCVWERLGDMVEAWEGMPEPGVFLVDVEMRGASEWIRQMREHERTAHIPIVAALTSGSTAAEVLSQGAEDVLRKDSDPVEIRHRLGNYARMRDYNVLLKGINTLLDLKVRERTVELRDALGESRRGEYEIAYRLGRAAEYKDVETGMHIRRVSYYSAKLADLAGLDAREVDLILYASTLHDVGKVGIPDAILMKPGRLDAEETEVMKTHSALGAAILEDVGESPVLKAGARIALEHHENYDGSGYPLGKRGEEIDLFARICCIVDVFDALTSRRVYKPPYPFEDVVEVMKIESGVHFDPELLSVFLGNLGEFEVIMRRFEDEGVELPRKGIGTDERALLESIIGRR